MHHTYHPDPHDSANPDEPGREHEHDASESEAASMQADDTASKASGDGVINLIAQVDEQLKRIREAQQAQDDGLTSLADRFHELEESERAIKQERESLDADRAAFMQQREEIERMQVELGREQEAWETEQRERETRVNEQHESLRQREEELSRRQDEINAELDRSRERDAELQQQREAMEREREEMHRRIEDAEARLEESESRMNELTQQIASVEQERDASREQLAEQQRQLELAGEKLREFADALNEQNAQFGQAASAMALVKQQERKIAELHEQLAAALAADEAQNDDRAEEFRNQLQERDQQIESLMATIEQLRTELATLSEQQDAQPDGQATDDEREAEMQSLRDRITELERELSEAKDATAAAGAQPTSDSAADELRAKARRIAQVATHIRRRQRRLKQMRDLLRERAAGLPRRDASTNAEDPAIDPGAVHEQHQALMQQSQEIEQQREHIKQMRAALTETERRMIRRWAKPRAVTMMLGVLVLLAANIIAAWGLANHFVPAERTASITIQPRTSTGQAMERADTERWQQWHAMIVNDESFIRTLAQRLRERRVDGFSDPATVKKTFRDHLTVDLGPAGAVTYTLAGRDAAQMTAVLDVLASTLVIESDRRMSTRSDRAWAVAQNERQEGGSLRYALMNPWTLADNRHLWMLPFLAGTLLLTAIAIWLIYTRLIRAKQLFEEATSVVDDEVLSPGF